MEITLFFVERENSEKHSRFAQLTTLEVFRLIENRDEKERKVPKYHNNGKVSTESESSENFQKCLRNAAQLSVTIEDDRRSRGKRAPKSGLTILKCFQPVCAP